MYAYFTTSKNGCIDEMIVFVWHDWALQTLISFESEILTTIETYLT